MIKRSLAVMAITCLISFSTLAGRYPHSLVLLHRRTEQRKQPPPETCRLAASPVTFRQAARRISLKRRAVCRTVSAELPGSIK